MTGDLFINGKDAFSTWGVRMGDGFLDAIDGFNQMKDYIENESTRAKSPSSLPSKEVRKVTTGQRRKPFRLNWRKVP